MKNLLCCLLLFATITHGQSNRISEATYQKIKRLPDSTQLFHGRLILVNVFKQQVLCLYENSSQPKSIIEKAMIEKTYLPYAGLWKDYVGDESSYTKWVTDMLVNSTTIDSKATSFADSKIDRFFKTAGSRMKNLTSYEPMGKWFLAFGHGVTDLGGFGDGTMVLDMSHGKVTPGYVELILPHEFNHQIFDVTNKEDTTARGLYRSINEGFAVYVNQLYYGKKYKLTDYLQYTDEELKIASDKESKIKTALRHLFFSNNFQDANTLASRAEKITPKGPGAIGYFIGYQIVQSYIKQNGKNSWKALYTLPVREILTQSAYRFD